MNNQNNTELAAAGRQFRDLMSSDTALIEIAKMISNLADKLDVTTLALREACKERDALAVESVQMLRLLTDISENHDEFVNEADEYMYASVPLDYVSEINMYVSRDVNAENPFAATDAAIANIQAQGVERFAVMYEKNADNYPLDSYAWREVMGKRAQVLDFAAELRKGAGNV